MRPAVHHLFLLFLVSASHGCYWATPDFPRDEPDDRAYIEVWNQALEVRELVNDRNFREAEALLTSAQERYERGEGDDISVRMMFSVFSARNLSLKDVLDEWITKFPESYAARMARGDYLATMGWLHRGMSWASETSEEQFAEMRKHHSQAREDFLEALRLNPKLTVAIASSIELGKNDELYRRALEMDQDSFVIHSARLSNLRPNWGGSLPEMARYVAKALEKLDANPNLIRLKINITHAKARQLRREDRFDEAADLYLEVLDELHLYGAFIGLGVTYRRGERYADAIEVMNRALELRPESPAALLTRGWSYVHLGQVDSGLADLEKVRETDPLSIDLNTAIASAYDQKGDFRRAYEHYALAARFDGQAWYWRRMAKLLAFKLDNPEEAERLAQMAVEEEPDNKWNWYYLSVALFRMQDMRARETLERYLGLADPNASSDTQLIAWAERVLTHIRDHGTLPGIDSRSDH